MSERAIILLFFLISTLWAEVKKGPYLLYEGSNTSMTILWQLSEPLECIVSWGTNESYELGSAKVTEYGSDHQYKLTLENLSPGTLYHYSVSGVGSGTFRTAPSENSTKVKLFAYGDTRSNATAHNSVCQGMVNRYTTDSELHSAILFSGDYVGQGGSESDWSNQFFSRKTGIMKLQADLPVVGAIGNHEGERTGGTELLKKYYPFPHETNSGFYWSTDFGPVHVIYVNQYTESYAPGSPQYNWLMSDLASTDREWIVIVLHSPGYSAGGGHENEKDVQNYIQPLAEQYGVDMVITGDNHYYARAEVSGVQHITTGGGGAPLYNPDDTYPYIVRADKSYHFCEFEFDEKSCTVTARRSNGSVIETFTLEHEGTKTPKVSLQYPKVDTTIGVDSVITIIADINSYGEPISTVELLVNGLVYDEKSVAPFEFDFYHGIPDTVTVSINAKINESDYKSSPITLSIVNLFEHEFSTSSQVARSSDDAEEYIVDGTVDINSSDLEFSLDPKFGKQIVGIRFDNLKIPENAIITEAWIQFTADEIGNGKDTFVIAGEKSGSSETFKEERFNISERIKTTSKVSWSPSEWTNIGVASSKQKTPNLKDIINEIVSIVDWDGSVSFIFSGTDENTGVRTSESFDGTQTEAPVLLVSYKLDQATSVVRNSFHTPNSLMTFYPNPLKTGEHGQFVFNLPNMNELEKVEITIFSYLGIPLFYSGSVEGNAINNITWDGTNMSGMIVGTGAYLAMVSIWDSDGVESKVKLSIGVKR